MKIFGKTLSEYIRFQKIFLILILVIGLTRLALTLAGVENSVATWFSLTAITTLGWLYYSVRVYTSGFGTYKHLLPLLVIQNTLAQSIAVTGIAIAIFTGKNNIFTADGFSGPYEGRSWLHAGGHILFGVILLSIIWWGAGAIIMFATKKVMSRGNSKVPNLIRQR
jgi:hypothetical protein